jgi:hypothetical protein
MQFFLLFLIGVVLFYSFGYFPYSTIALSLISALTLFVRKNYLLIAVFLTGAMFAFLRSEPPAQMPHMTDEMKVQGVFREIPARPAAECSGRRSP